MNFLPMICIPTGSPASVSPAGTEAAGLPVKFSKNVSQKPISGSVLCPFTSSGPFVFPSDAFGTGAQIVTGERIRSYLLKTSSCTSRISVRISFMALKSMMSAFMTSAFQ